MNKMKRCKRCKECGKILRDWNKSGLCQAHLQLKSQRENNYYSNRKCLDCGKPIFRIALRCRSCARKHDWRIRKIKEIR